ncbi:MAG: MerR family transcriptional regulator [Candidatus Anammoxibacter sp.]
MKTSGEVCRELNIKHYQLEYLVQNRLIPTPKKSGSGQRLFTNEDIQRIKEKLFEMKTR